MSRPPVIILGMHRSGTTMIARILEELGLFIGTEKEANNEAVFFLNLNNHFLKKSGASWDNPKMFYGSSDETMTTYTSEANTAMSSDNRQSFLGELTNTYKSIADLDINWGWKEPRTTITAEVWKRIFPSAKILHIYRNPIDVAESLRKRELINHKNRFKRALISIFRPKQKEFVSSALMDVNNGLALWHFYLSEALKLDALFPDNIFSIKYEDFLEAPEVITKQVLDFINLETKLNIFNLCKDIKRDRRYAFLTNPELVDVYKSIKDRPALNDMLLKLGYNDLI